MLPPQWSSLGTAKEPDDDPFYLLYCPDSELAHNFLIKHKTYPPTLKAPVPPGADLMDDIEQARDIGLKPLG